MKFAGAEYSEGTDHKRLKKQVDKIKALMSDRAWRTHQEIADIIGAPHSSVSSQLRNLRMRENGGFVIERRARGRRESALFEYRILPRVRDLLYYQTEVERRQKILVEVELRYKKALHELNNAKKEFKKFTCSKVAQKLPLGFTGTKDGMTAIQFQQVYRLLKKWSLRRSIETHDGDCVGADKQFNEIATSLDCFTIGHPPENNALRAFCKYKQLLPCRPYLVRNQDIVDGAERLIATPGNYQQPPKSGTWSTVRKALKAGVRVWLVLPDGTVETDPAEIGGRLVPPFSPPERGKRLF